MDFSAKSVRTAECFEVSGISTCHVAALDLYSCSFYHRPRFTYASEMITQLWIKMSLQGYIMAPLTSLVVGLV